MDVLSFHRDAEPLDRKVRCSVDDQTVSAVSWGTCFCAEGLETLRYSLPDAARENHGLGMAAEIKRAIVRHLYKNVHTANPRA